VSNSFEMDPSTGRQLLNIVGIPGGTGGHWIESIMPNGFGGSGWGYCGRYLQVKFSRLEKRVCERTSHWNRIRESGWSYWPEVTPRVFRWKVQSCDSLNVEWL